MRMGCNGLSFPSLRFDPPRTRVMDEEQQLDTAMEFRTVFGHLTGCRRKRNVAEDADLSLQHASLEGAQLCSRPFIRSMNTSTACRLAGRLDRATPRGRSQSMLRASNGGSRTAGK
jgi:hypothetical protein